MIEAQFKVDFGPFLLDVDLQLPSTGFTVIAGHSGSGKTTLLRCIAGLQKPQSGRLKIHQHLWQDSQQNLYQPAHQRAIGYVFQQASLFPHLSVADNIAFGLKRLNKPSLTAPEHELVQLLGIDHLLQRFPQSLSGGEQQRVAIARALVLQPAVLLMDEPLASLDWQRKEELLPYFQRLQQNLQIPVLYVTHSVQEMAQLADYLVLMEQGRIQACGPRNELLSRTDLPLARQRDASMIWSAEVAELDEAFALCHLQFEGGQLFVPSTAHRVGDSVRVQIFARDVSICLQRPAASSVLNILAARIEQITDTCDGQTLVLLRLGTQSLLAHITQKSRQLLDLQPGMAVFAQIKGTSFLGPH